MDNAVAVTGCGAAYSENYTGSVVGYNFLVNESIHCVAPRGRLRPPHYWPLHCNSLIILVFNGRAHFRYGFGALTRV